MELLAQNPFTYKIDVHRISYTQSIETLICEIFTDLVDHIKVYETAI